MLWMIGILGLLALLIGPPMWWLMRRDARVRRREDAEQAKREMLAYRHLDDDCGLEGMKR